MDFVSSLTGIRNAFILMAVVLLIEAAVPLYRRTRDNSRHLLPNTVLMLVTFALGAVLNAGVLGGLVYLHAARLGLFNVIAAPRFIEVTTVLVVLDFAWYLTHVSMHKSALLWRFHVVHHSDKAVDVTTTYRQHPVEGLVRYVFLASFAFALGASPTAFAFYRIWSVLAGQVEHANIDLPQWLDTAISWVTMSPVMHKVHHARDPKFTDTNYSQIFSIFDRLFGTRTPAHLGRNIRFGLDGHDEPQEQSTLGLLTRPFRVPVAPSGLSAGSAQVQG